MTSLREIWLAAAAAAALAAALPAAARPDQYRDSNPPRAYFNPRPAEQRPFERVPRGGDRFGGAPQNRFEGNRFEGNPFDRAPSGPPQQRFAPPYDGGFGQPYREPQPRRPPDRGWRQQEDFVRRGVREGQLAPLGSVIAHIRRVTPGRQLDAGLEYMGPRLVYRVRWMTPRGQRIDFVVDAATGAIISDR